jgi:hypothetical protein
MRWSSHVARSWGNLKERDGMKGLGLDGWILKWSFKRGWDWIGMARDRDNYLNYLNTVIKLWLS